ncbi:MAG: UDP-N-acetylglucosamine 1-carboxyvinyltransferase [Pseudomonadota bacterium]
MDRLIIEGGKKLEGEVTISGAKNAALPALACSLLTDQEVSLSNFPILGDTKFFIKILENLGVKVQLKNNEVILKADEITNTCAEYEMVRKMRASIVILGPLAARFGSVKISLPGGCAIGKRPVDLHIMALEKLGAKIQQKHGYIVVNAENLKGANIHFPKVTVTGTINILMAASIANGITTIDNAACEPEVTFIAQMLVQMGANIKGIGTNSLICEGVNKLSGCNMDVIPDRIESGTYIAAAAITNGNVLINNCNPAHLKAVLHKYKEIGVNLKINEDSIEVLSNGKIKGTKIETKPYPGFPTDMQAQFTALLTVADGQSTIVENIFENRFMHTSELARMGAKIDLHGNCAIIEGRKHLSGANVMATDLRASASLVIAALAAQGYTEISRVYHLDRGYENIDEKLRNLGALIERIK